MWYYKLSKVFFNKSQYRMQCASSNYFWIILVTFSISVYTLLRAYVASHFIFNCIVLNLFLIIEVYSSISCEVTSFCFLVFPLEKLLYLWTRTAFTVIIMVLAFVTLKQQRFHFWMYPLIMARETMGQFWTLYPQSSITSQQDFQLYPDVNCKILRCLLYMATFFCMHFYVECNYIFRDYIKKLYTQRPLY